MTEILNLTGDWEEFDPETSTRSDRWDIAGILNIKLNGIIIMRRHIHYVDGHGTYRPDDMRGTIERAAARALCDALTPGGF